MCQIILLQKMFLLFMPVVTVLGVLVSDVVSEPQVGTSSLTECTDKEKITFKLCALDVQGLSSAVIAGIIVGCLAVLLIILSVYVILLVIRKRRHNKLTNSGIYEGFLNAHSLHGYQSQVGLLLSNQKLRAYVATATMSVGDNNVEY